MQIGNEEKKGVGKRETMYSEDELKEIQRRSNFYNMKEVAKFLLAVGVPKTRQAMMKLISLENAAGKNNQESLDCLEKVVFAVHPQQINVRDKISGQIIASIPR